MIPLWIFKAAVSSIIQAEMDLGHIESLSLSLDKTTLIMKDIFIRTVKLWSRMVPVKRNQAAISMGQMVEEYQRRCLANI